MKHYTLLTTTLATVAMVALLTACSNNELEIVDTTPAKKVVTITATCESGTTRLAYSDAKQDGIGTGLGVKWATGDSIKLYRDGKGVGFVLTDGNGNATATFESTADEPTGTGNYKAFFPASKADVRWVDCIFSVLGQVQKGQRKPIQAAS